MTNYISLPVVLLIVVLGSATALNAQVPKASPISKNLVVNGQPIKANVLVIDGKHFVAIEDLAQGLAGSISYGSETLTLTFPVTASQDAKHDAGRIKGTLTYFFNSNYGSKPDTGIRVWLLNGHLDIANGQMFFVGNDQLLVGSTSQKLQMYAVVKKSTADGNGNFELFDVPPGSYVLIVQSSHAKGSGMRDIDGKVRVQQIEIRAGETVDGSWDFGMTAY